MPVDKRCKSCDEMKPLSDFTKRSCERDGYHWRCRLCNQAAQKAWRDANREHVIQRKRAYYAKPANSAQRRLYMREYRKRKATETAEQCKKWLEKPGNRERKIRYMFEYQRLPDVKRRGIARRRLNDAIAAGRVLRPDVCPRCGTKPVVGKVEGHHQDYDKPFEVEWMCRKCHAALHRALRGPDSLPDRFTTARSIKLTGSV